MNTIELGLTNYELEHEDISRDFKMKPVQENKMKRQKAVTALGLFLALGMLGAGRVFAAATVFANEDLLVTFAGSLSVKIDGIQYSSRTLTGASQTAGNAASGQTVVPGSSATVTNDAAGITEKWQLTTADVGAATPLWGVVSTTGATGGGTFCSVTGGGTCPGTDQYALQALFISSAAVAVCPSNTSVDWDSYVSTVGTVGNTYLLSQYADTAAVFAGISTPDQTTGAQNGNMFANVASGVGRRGLCVRLTMPAGSTSVGQHVIRLTITALNGG